MTGPFLCAYTQDALGWFERCTDFEPENKSEIQVEQPSELQSGEDIETPYHHNQQVQCSELDFKINKITSIVFTGTNVASL